MQAMEATTEATKVIYGVNELDLDLAGKSIRGNRDRECTTDGLARGKCNNVGGIVDPRRHAALRRIAQACAEAAVNDGVDVGRVRPGRQRGAAVVGDLDLEPPSLARHHDEIEVRSRLAYRQQGELDLTVRSEGCARREERDEKQPQQRQAYPMHATCLPVASQDYGADVIVVVSVPV